MQIKSLCVRFFAGIFRPHQGMGRDIWAATVLIWPKSISVRWSESPPVPLTRPKSRISRDSKRPSSVVRRHVRNWNVSGQRGEDKGFRNSDLAVYSDMGESKCAFGAIIIEPQSTNKSRWNGWLSDRGQWGLQGNWRKFSPISPTHSPRFVAWSISVRLPPSLHLNNLHINLNPRFKK